MNLYYIITPTAEFIGKIVFYPRLKIYVASKNQRQLLQTKILVETLNNNFKGYGEFKMSEKTLTDSVNPEDI